MTRDEAAATVREATMFLHGQGKTDLAHRLNHVADAIQTNTLGEPTLWDV